MRTRLEVIIDRDLDQCVKQVKGKIDEMNVAGVSKQEIGQYLLSFYECIDSRMVEIATVDGVVSDEHVDNVLKTGITIWIPPVQEMDVDGVFEKLKQFGLSKEEPQVPDTILAGLETGPLYDMLTSRHREEKTPLGGLSDKRTELCRIETKHGGCGCAFGQCGRGLIY